jgi:hypothetical protein
LAPIVQATPKVPDDWARQPALRPGVLQSEPSVYDPMELSLQVRVQARVRRRVHGWDCEKERRSWQRVEICLPVNVAA